MFERLRAEADVDLDRPGMQVLWLLDEGPLRLSQVAARLGLDLSTISRKVAQLERAGLVERGEDPADRRAAAIALSVSGRDVHARLQAARRGMLEHLLT